MIIGETAGAQRFRNKDAYARFTGTAPIPVWSGSTSGKVRLNRGGNRWINCALHMIALTQTRGLGPGKDYVDKLTALGKTRVEAVRLLRRRLSDVVYLALITDERCAAQPVQCGEVSCVSGHDHICGICQVGTDRSVCYSPGTPTLWLCDLRVCRFDADWWSLAGA